MAASGDDTSGVEDSGGRQGALSASAWDNVREGLRGLRASPDKAERFQRKLGRTSALSLSAQVRKHQLIATDTLSDYAADLRADYRLRDDDRKLDAMAAGAADRTVIEQFDAGKLDDGYQLFAAGLTADRKHCNAVLLTWNIGALQDILQLSHSNSVALTGSWSAPAEQPCCCLVVCCRSVARYVKAALRFLWGVSTHHEPLQSPKSVTARPPATRPEVTSSPVVTSSDTDDLLHYFRVQALLALKAEGVIKQE